MLVMLLPVVSTDDGGYISLHCKSCDEQYETITFEHEWNQPGDLLVDKYGYCNECFKQETHVSDSGEGGHGPLGANSCVKIECTSKSCHNIYGTISWNTWNKRRIDGYPYRTGYCSRDCTPISRLSPNKPQVKIYGSINSSVISAIQTHKSRCCCFQITQQQSDYTNIYNSEEEMEIKSVTESLHNFPKSLHCVKKSEFQLLTKEPEPIHQYIKGIRYIRADNVVYVRGHKHFWKILLPEHIQHNVDRIVLKEILLETGDEKIEKYGLIKTSPYDIKARARDDASKCRWCICKCFRLLRPLLNFTMIKTILYDCFLIRTFYVNKDLIFFGLSLSFIILELLFVELYVYYWVYRYSKYRQYNIYKSLQRCGLTPIIQCIYLVPILNIPVFLSTIDHSVITYISSAITLFSAVSMDFPFYIINLSFICTSIATQNLDLYDLPLINRIGLLWGLFALNILAWKTLITFITASYYRIGLILSFKDKWLKLFPILLLTLTPSAIMDTTHFIPIIFSYYIEQTIDYGQLWIIAFISICCRLVIIALIWRKFVWFEFKKNKFCSVVWWTLFMLIMFGTAPLSSYYIVTFTEKIENKQKCLYTICNAGKKLNYIVIAYILIIIYGTSLVLLIYFVGFENISFTLKFVITALFIMILFILVTFPFLYYPFKKYLQFDSV